MILAPLEHLQQLLDWLHAHSARQEPTVLLGRRSVLIVRPEHFPVRERQAARLARSASLVTLRVCLVAVHVVLEAIAS